MWLHICVGIKDTHSKLPVYIWTKGVLIGIVLRREPEDGSFDWFKSYADVADIFRDIIPNKSARILMLGCGNSKLSEDVSIILYELSPWLMKGFEMYDDGYHKIVNVDVRDFHHARNAVLTIHSILASLLRRCVRNTNKSDKKWHVGVVGTTIVRVLLINHSRARDGRSRNGSRNGVIRRCDWQRYDKIMLKRRKAYIICPRHDGCYDDRESGCLGKLESCSSSFARHWKRLQDPPEEVVQNCTREVDEVLRYVKTFPRKPSWRIPDCSNQAVFSSTLPLDNRISAEDISLERAQLWKSVN